MKKTLKIVCVILIVPIACVLLFALAAYLVIYQNLWPPSCDMIPIPQARDVCEFSKLDKAPAGQPAKYTFWITVPFNTPAVDKVLLAIEGKEPVEMKRINETSFETEVNLTTGDKLKYHYLRNSADSTSDQKELNIKSLEKKVYDYVSAWSDLEPAARLSKDLYPVVDMIDTWTINYNMQLLEDSRRNLDSTMARIKAMGGKEILIYSLVEMFGNKENFTLQEVEPMPTFIFAQLRHKYMRDAQITEREMKQIVNTAQKYGLEVLLKYNIEADYTQYINISSGFSTARGSGGNAAEERAGADFGRNEPKTKEWLDRYFSQLKNILVNFAKRAENAGVDKLDLTPHYKPPTVEPLQDYADEKWREIVKAVREVYHGKIYNVPDGDGIYIGVISSSCGINVKPNAAISEMKAAWKMELDKVKAEYETRNIPVVYMNGCGSYDGAASGKVAMEFADYIEVEAAGYQPDWQEQADTFEAFFQALSEHQTNTIVGFGTMGFAWDDMLRPYIKPYYNDLSGNIRNKPAEAVWKKWVFAMQ